MNDEPIIIIRARELRQIIREEVQAATKRDPEPEFSDRLTRRQAAKFMQVNYQTMYNYTKAGIIQEHGTKGKKFYLKSELIEVMKNKSLKP